MPIYEIRVCDNCNEEKEIKYLIYKIGYWNIKDYTTEEKDYIRDNDCALMLCSKKCIGEYISNLLSGEIV